MSTYINPGAIKDNSITKSKISFDVQEPLLSGSNIDITNNVVSTKNVPTTSEMTNAINSSISSKANESDLIDPSSTSNIGWINSTDQYTGRHLTNGGGIVAANRNDYDTGETYPGAVGFSSGASMSPAEKLTLTFKGLRFE